MADIDVLPSRGVPFRAMVDSTGVSINGSSTVAQLAARGMHAVCAVDGTGVAITGGASLAQLAAAGIRPFCAVDQNGVAQDSSTVAQLQTRGIRPVVLLDASGIALNGSDGMLALRARGFECFCPVDEGGNATTMGAVVIISNSTVADTATIGTTVGVLSVAGGSGTYTWSLLSNPGGLFAISGSNLNVAAALTAGVKPITVQASGGVPTPVTRIINITVTGIAPTNTVLPVISGTAQDTQTLTTTNGTWTGSATITYAYQWKRSGANISGATASSYLLVTADVGAMITVTVTATNAVGSVGATSAAVGPVTAAGTGPGAPVLVWTSDSTDFTPTYSVDLPSGSGPPSDAIDGDIVWLEEADNAGFVTDASSTLDAGIVTGDIIAMESTTLAAGVYYARARLQRGAAYGPYSNVVTVTIGDLVAPTITSPASFSQPENAGFSTTLTASETVTWTITGGADSAQFSIAGAVLSMAAKDFEIPVDANTDNAYLVQVTATDPSSNATSQTITVTITNVVEVSRNAFGINGQFVNTTTPRSYGTAAGYVVET